MKAKVSAEQQLDALHHRLYKTQSSSSAAMDDAQTAGAQHAPGSLWRHLK